MSVDDETLSNIEKEVEEKTSDFDKKVQEAVEARLKSMEEEKTQKELEAKKEQEAQTREEETRNKLAEMEGKTRELEKQLEGFSKRKSIPADSEATEQDAEPKPWKELSKEEKIKHQKAYASKALNMEI